MIPIFLMQDNLPLELDYLVVAGGGGGGTGEGGGGGGAGGYLCGVSGEQSGGPSSPLGTLTFFGGEAIQITVGAGGATNVSGSNSVLASLTAIGGGKGATPFGTSAAEGGSGGGGVVFDETGAAGTTDQGNAGSDFGGGGNNYPATFAAGGGGGASAVGNVSAGGAGIASAITGSAVTRAGGGGAAKGSTNNSDTSGGAGGGGRGADNGYTTQEGYSALAGTVNTGGGGGGGYVNAGFGINFPGQPGGSGIVVLRYSSLATIINFIDPGLTYTFSDDGTYKRYVFTAGAGNIRF